MIKWLQTDESSRKVLFTIANVESGSTNLGILREMTGRYLGRGLDVRQQETVLKNLINRLQAKDLVVREGDVVKMSQEGYRAYQDLYFG